jgi:hypothetical protein
MSLVLALVASPAVAQCRQALLLALDVSGSVDQREYRLQLDGVAAAISDPAVQEALLLMPAAPVRLAVMEWSGPAFQRIILPWRAVTDAADIATIATQLRSTERMQADLSTAIGSTLLRGTTEMAGQRDCWRRVIDVSGDGKSNTGPQPQSVASALGDIIVNGLVIGEAVPTAGEGRSPGLAELTAYYRAYVLHGDESFLETAYGFEDFEAAMIRKLLRELQVVAISRAEGSIPRLTPYSDLR